MPMRLAATVSRIAALLPGTGRTKTAPPSIRFDTAIGEGLTPAGASRDQRQALARRHPPARAVRLLAQTMVLRMLFRATSSQCRSPANACLGGAHLRLGLFQSYAVVPSAGPARPAGRPRRRHVASTRLAVQMLGLRLARGGAVAVRQADRGRRLDLSGNHRVAIGWAL